MQNKFLLSIQINFIFLLLLSFNANAQEFGKLRGVVTDSTNGEALAFCNVYINELKTGASTNERGLFLINSISRNDPLNVGPPDRYNALKTVASALTS